MKTVTLPHLDHTGKLTPLVLDALKAGATSANDPENAERIILTFQHAKDADALRKAVDAILPPVAAPVEQSPESTDE